MREVMALKVIQVSVSPHYQDSLGKCPVAHHGYGKNRLGSFISAQKNNEI